MRVGIYSRYHRHEVSYVAIRLAEWLRERGHESSILSATPQRVRLHPAWDRRVIYQSSKTYTHWARHQDSVVWTHLPPVDQIAWTHKQGKMTVLLAPWDEYDTASKSLLNHTATALFLSRVAADAIRSRWKAKNVIAVPWDTGYPVTEKSGLVSEDTVNILVPLHDSQSRRVDASFLGVIEYLLHEVPSLNISVSYSTNILGSSHRRLKDMSRAYDARLRLHRNPSALDRMWLYANHDLTVWPAMYDGLAIVGVESLTMGTPVVCFDVAPINDSLTRRNTLLVPAAVHTEQGMTPTVIDTYDAFSETLLQLLLQPALIVKLIENASYGFKARRDNFNKMMSGIFA